MATKKEAIVAALRRRILSGEVARGERLRQDEVAAWFGTSITPVREAFNSLLTEGLVTAEAHRGIRVAEVDLERVKTQYVVRMLLEPYAVRRAVLRVSRLELREAAGLVEELAAAIAAGDGEARTNLNRRFHFFFYSRCGLPGLTAEIDALWDSFPWDLNLDDSAQADASNVEHAELLDAVTVGDEDAAAEVMRRHIRRSFLTLAQRASGEPVADPFDIESD